MLQHIPYYSQVSQNRFDVTNVGKSFDFTELINNADTNNSDALRVNPVNLDSSNQSEINVDYLFNDVSSTDPLDLSGQNVLNR